MTILNTVINNARLCTTVGENPIKAYEYHLKEVDDLVNKVYPPTIEYHINDTSIEYATFENGMVVDTGCYKCLYSSFARAYFWLRICNNPK